MHRRLFRVSALLSRPIRRSLHAACVGYQWMPTTSVHQMRDMSVDSVSSVADFQIVSIRLRWAKEFTQL